MWLDIALCILLLGCIIGGYHSGFVQSFLHTGGWLLSIILSFAWYPMVSAIVKESTGLYTMLHESISLHVEENTSAAGGAMTGLPAILQETVNTAAQSLGQSIASQLADLLFSIASVVLIVLTIRLIIFLLSFLFSKKHNDGYIGFMDGVSGAVLGAVKGSLLILLLLALFVPLRELISFPLLWDTLDQSRLTLWLYDNNPLLLFNIRLF